MENNEHLRIDPTVAYDVVELPSRGIMYPSGVKSVKVAYLTASDENILSSPNLVAKGDVITELLNRKILTKELPVDEITIEDKQAILIFLRTTAFGPELKVKLKDPKTDELFDHEINLGELNYKEFNLVEDSNKEYPYFMEKSKVDVTFKFLTEKEEKEIEDLSKSWNGLGVAPTVTKRLEKLIKSIKGNNDMMAIRNFVETLPIVDSQNFRKYVKENKPGVDLTQKVIAPSGELVTFNVDFGVEFFRPFYGL
jgi:hypothetical protein